MKLIDFLVQELPKIGGWPEGAVECCWFRDESNLNFYDEHGNWPHDCVANFCLNGVEFEPGKNGIHEIKKCEYEAALAASQQPAWNGEGLPPVGCECEFKEQSEKFWQKGVVRYISDHTIVIEISPEEDEDGDKEPCFENDGSLSFRQIRTEAERKRDEALSDLESGLGHAHGLFDLAQIYNLIASGKVRGIKLDGES